MRHTTDMSVAVDVVTPALRVATGMPDTTRLAIVTHAPGTTPAVWATDDNENWAPPTPGVDARRQRTLGEYLTLVSHTLGARLIAPYPDVVLIRAAGLLDETRLTAPNRSLVLVDAVYRAAIDVAPTPNVAQFLADEAYKIALGRLQARSPAPAPPRGDRQRWRRDRPVPTPGRRADDDLRMVLVAAAVDPDTPHCSPLPDHTPAQLRHLAGLEAA